MLTFAYACPVKYGNPMGNRISKTVTDMTGKKAPFTTYYTRDAQGNTMAVYDNSSLKSDIAICELDRPYLEQISRNIITYKAKSLIAEEEDFYQNSINEYISQNWQGDSCKYKYMSLISEKNIPCFIEQEDYNIIEQLYYQDFGYFQSVETSARKSYLSQKHNEYYENMGDRTYCFIQELSIAMEQPIDAFEAWLMHQKRTDLRSKLDVFYTELAQTSIYYGILNDTAYQDSLYWKEQHLYGSSRLGIAKPELEVTNYTPSNFSLLTSNFKNYELTNHLGNILATIKDEKQQIDQNADGIVDYYEPIVITANDYYPFGMLMPNRSFSIAGSGYRFGFNGKENDRETGTQDYGFRIYNPQIGKFLSVDPLFKSYPWYTPYQFAGNKPIAAIDIDGLEELIVVRWFDDANKYQGRTVVKLENDIQRDGGRSTGVQIIELNSRHQTSTNNVINGKDLRIGGIFNLLKDGDGLFKGIYRNSLNVSESKLLNQLQESINNGLNPKITTTYKLTLMHPYDSKIALSSENLDKINTALDQDPDLKIEINSYSSIENNTGKPDYNLNKSLERGGEIERKVGEKSGYEKIKTCEGEGATEIFNRVDMTPTENLELNRRTEIKGTYDRIQN